MARQVGTPNKRTQETAEKLARLGCDPITGMAHIAMNKLPCGVCRGELKTRYKLAEGVHTPECRQTLGPCGPCTCEGVGTRICQSCYGSGWEACSPELRGKMYAEIAQYVLPKRKAIEHSGIDGEDIGVKLVVEFTK